jgi:hypothetical protein
MIDLVSDRVIDQVQPDRGQARRWAQEELSRPEYARDRPGWFARLIDWLNDHLQRASGHLGIGGGQLLALIAILVVGAVVLVVVLRRNVRLRVATPAHAPSVLGATTRTGAEHRRLAEQAFADGRYDEAVREWLRALARRLDERGLVDPQPGRTADELAAETAQLLPAFGAELGWAAGTFDAVSYGSRPARRADAARMRELEAAVEAARPPARSGLVGAP